MTNVSIVLVSHSAKLAEGIREMIHQMVGDNVQVAAVGGNLAGDLGTDPKRIRGGIEEVWSDAGVAILVDLGGAEMNSEMAIEALEPKRRSKVVICDAPIVEGAVVAATAASGGSSLAVVRATAEAVGR